MLTGIPLYQVDAFTKEAFGGNPAAVCLMSASLAAQMSDKTRAIIAAEMNLSETAFLECVEGSDDFTACSRFNLRWFTPAIEVPLCGHATLAAAAALILGEGNTSPTIFFDTLSGELSVTASPAGGFCMQLPLLAPTATPPKDTGIGSDLVHAAVGELPVAEVLYCEPLKYLVIVLQKEPEATQAAFEGMSPDIQRLFKAHGAGGLVGVIVTLRGDGETHDFYSRFFGPWAGIDEDPVTGSAHSVLGPYWAGVLGKKSLKARQCSKRGGELAVEVKEDKVEVTGGAVVVVKGQLFT